MAIGFLRRLGAWLGGGGAGPDLGWLYALGASRRSGTSAKSRSRTRPGHAQR